MNKIHILEKMIQATTEKQYLELRASFEQGGYSLFSALLHEIKKQLMASEEEQLTIVESWINKGKSIVPFPERISPSWKEVWSEFARIIDFKKEAMAKVPTGERDGEWQIVMDNPFTNEGITCYPGLSFVEAAYLYAYFRKDLNKNEYIRLQKIVNLLVIEGT